MDNKLYRRNNKLCIRCGNALDRVGSYCIKCNEINNKQRKTTVNEIHSKGLCTSCKKPLDREGWFCTKCNNDLKLMQKNRIEKRKAEGLCIQCGSKSVEGKVRCQVCLDKNRIAIKKARDSKKVKKDG